MNTQPLQVTTVVLHIGDPSLRETVRDLAELAGAHVPEDPWNVDVQDPNFIVILGAPPSPADLAELDALARGRAFVVSTEDRRPADGDPPWIVLPDQTETLLEHFGVRAQAGAVVSISGLHGAAGASRFAATLARLAADQELRVALVDAAPHPTVDTLGLLQAGEGEHWGRAMTWAAIGDAQDLVPLRLVRSLPTWQRVRILSGKAVAPPVVLRAVAALRRACDVVVVDGLRPGGDVHRELNPDVEVVIGVAGIRSAQAWRKLDTNPKRQLILRTPGDMSVDETIEESGALMAHVWRSERGVDQDTRRGGAPGDNRKSTTWRLAREMWSQWSA